MSILDEKQDLNQRAFNLIAKMHPNTAPTFHLKPNFSIIKANLTAAKLLQAKPEALQGKNLIQLIEKNFRPHFCNLISLLKDSSNHIRLFSQKSLLHESTTFHWSLVENFNQQSEVSGFILIGYCFEKFTKQYKELTNIKNFFKNIILHLSHYIYWKDKNSIYLGCNHNFAHLMGLKKVDHIIGKTDYSLLWSKQIATLERYDKSTLDFEETVIEKIAFYHPQQGNKIFLIHQTAMQSPNPCILGLLVDITEKKSTAENHQTLTNPTKQIQSKFLASMSHDLRTPLNTIMMATQLLQTKPSYEEQKEMIEAISKSSYALLDFIKDILNFSKIEVGHIKMQTASFDLRKSLEQVCSMFIHKAAEKNIDILIEYNEFVPRYVISDPLCINRILINLIDNAIKFTEKGYVLIKFEAIKQTHLEASICITIQDTGIGIPKSKIDTIFERFSRIEPSYKGKYAGCGLGLTAVKSLVTRMGGHMEVNSSLKQGSTFVIHLPFKLQKSRTEPICHASWYQHYAKVPVLIIDDFTLRGQILLKHISANESRLLSSDKIEKTLKWISKKKINYDIIIIDDHLKWISSLELAKVLRSIPSLKNSLILHQTTPPTFSLKEKAKNSGFSGELIKPLKPSLLLPKLSILWNQWLAKNKGYDYLLKNFQPFILLIEKEPVNQKIIKLILTELYCICEIKNEYQSYDSFYRSYDLVIISLETCFDQASSLIKEISSPSNNNPKVPYILLGMPKNERDYKTLKKIDPFSLLATPVDHKELKHAMIKKLFP